MEKTKVSSNFQKKSSQVFLAMFIGIIIISFTMSGPFLNSGTPKSIGSIAGLDIQNREFNHEVKRQSQFYERFFNDGKPLSSQDLKKHQIYSKAIESLSQRKLLLFLAQKSGIPISPKEIKKDIKKTDFFQVNKEFNLNRYKAILQANTITPKEYEEETRNKLLLAKYRKFTEGIPLSFSLKKKITTLTNQNKEFNFYILNFKEFQKTLKVSKSEIEKYIKKNETKVRAAFKAKQSELSIPEQVKTRHILLRVSDEAKSTEVLKRIEKIKKELTSKNFIKLAKKYTEETSNKKNGGDLGWVKRGQMVKTFEEMTFSLKENEISSPVKTKFGYHIIFVTKKRKAVKAIFEKHKSQIAKKIIQEEKDISKVVSKIEKEIKTAIRSESQMKNLTSKYNLSKMNDMIVNRLQANIKGYKFSSKELYELFSHPQEKFYSYRNKEMILFGYIVKDKVPSRGPFNFSSSETILASAAQKTLLKHLSERHKFKQNNFSRISQ